MEKNTGNSVSVWKTAFKGILDSKSSTKDNNNVHGEKIEAESINNYQNKNEIDEPLNNNHNECENIQNKELDKAGGRLFSLLKEALHENKKSSPPNSIAPCDHLQSSKEHENDDLRNDKKSILLEESDDNSTNYDTNFPPLKVTKHNRLKKNGSGILDWNTAIQGAFTPKCIPDSSTKAPKQTEEEAYFSVVFRTLDSPQFNREKNHEVIEQRNIEHKEVHQYSSRSKCTRKLTTEEKEVLDILKAARTFKKFEKPHYNIFDGAGVDNFRDRERYCCRERDVLPLRSPISEEYCGKPSRFTDWPPSQDVISWDDLWDPEEEW